MGKFMIAAALFGAAAACTGVMETPAAEPSGANAFSLERTACFGFCPMYRAVVDESDRLSFEGERYVAVTDAVRSKQLPDGSLAKLVAIAKAHDFAAFDSAYPNADGSNCPQQATDLPGVIIDIKSETLTHSVRFDQGCIGFEGRERLLAMIGEVDAVLALDDWIGARGDFYGGEE